ncbi:MAG: hypothetical protein HKN16_06320 [Saprospiraceae bacterium]|nr:hypothetical protein [Saprospiraceae bacterium]
MRIICSETRDHIQISHFELDQKFMIKYEKGHLEITFKFRKSEKLNSPASLKQLDVNHFFEIAKLKLEELQSLRRESLEKYYSDDFEFETII